MHAVSISKIPIETRAVDNTIWAWCQKGNRQRRRRRRPPTSSDVDRSASPYGTRRVCVSARPDDGLMPMVWLYGRSRASVLARSFLAYFQSYLSQHKLYPFLSSPSRCLGGRMDGLGRNAIIRAGRQRQSSFNRRK